MTWLVVAVGLLLLVFLHELGHFTVALAVGNRPRGFYVGFGPKLASFTRNGIEYGLRLIPAGGYVRLPGMHRPAARDIEAFMGPALREDPSLAPLVQRARRALEIEDFAAARAAFPELKTAVEGAQLSPAARRSANRALRDIDEGTSDDAYWRQRTWKRVAVIFAGPGVNILVAILLIAIAYVVGVPGDADRVVRNVKAGTPAAAIGLREGDKIIAVDGKPTPDFNAVSHLIRSSNGKAVTVTVLRAGKPATLGPVKTKRIGGRWAIGFVPGWTEIQYGPVSAVRRSLDDTWSTTKATITFLPRLVTGSGRKDVSSPVGIVDYSSQAVSLTFTLFLQILGLISLSLAILNLLPLLPLDGGHILFSLIEGIRGRAVGREVYERVSAVGIALFLVLLFVGLSNDIGRLGGG